MSAIYSLWTIAKPNQYRGKKVRSLDNKEIMIEYMGQYIINLRMRVCEVV